MPISLVRSVKSTCSGQASLTLAINGVASGNKLVLLVANWQGTVSVGGGLNSVTSSPALTWRRDVDGNGWDQYTPGQPAQAAIWSADATVSGNYSVTLNFTGSDSYSQTTLAEFSGLATGAASLDVAQSQGAYWAMPSTGSTPNTVQANELVVAVLAVEGSSDTIGVTPPAKVGYTNIYSDDNSRSIVAFSADYKIISSVGSQIAQWGPLIADGSWYQWSASIASYKEATAVGGSTTVVLNSGTSWTVPGNISSLASVEVWGAGGSGGNRGSQPATGGGGGAYSAIINYGVTPGQVIPISIGSGGIQQTAPGDGFDGGDTWFATSGVLLAKGGTAGIGNGTGSHFGGTGGQASAGIGSTKYSGGAGGAGSVGGSASGGGGAATKNSAGSNGVTTTTAVASNGGAAGISGGAGGVVGGAAPAANVEGAGGGAGTIASGQDAQAGALPGGGGGAVGGGGNYSGAGGGGQIRIVYSATAPSSINKAGASLIANSVLTKGNVVAWRQATTSGFGASANATIGFGGVSATKSAAISGIGFTAATTKSYGSINFIARQFFLFSDVGKPVFDKTFAYKFSSVSTLGPVGSSGSSAGLTSNPSIAFSPGSADAVRNRSINGVAFIANQILVGGNLVGVTGSQFGASFNFSRTNIHVFDKTNSYRFDKVYGATQSNLNAAFNATVIFAVGNARAIRNVTPAGMAFTPAASANYGTPTAYSLGVVPGANFVVSSNNVFGQVNANRYGVGGGIAFSVLAEPVYGSGLARKNINMPGVDLFASSTLTLGAFSAGKTRFTSGVDFSVSTQLVVGTYRAINNKIQSGVDFATTNDFTPGTLVIGLAGNNGGVAFTAGSAMVAGAITPSRLATPPETNYNVSIKLISGQITTRRNDQTNSQNIAVSTALTAGTAYTGEVAKPAGVAFAISGNLAVGAFAGVRNIAPIGNAFVAGSSLVTGTIASQRNGAPLAIAASVLAEFVPGVTNIIYSVLPSGINFNFNNNLSIGLLSGQRNATTAANNYAINTNLVIGGVTTGFNPVAQGINFINQAKIDPGLALSVSNTTIVGVNYNNYSAFVKGVTVTQRSISTPVAAINQIAMFTPGFARGNSKRRKVRITLFIGSLVDDRVVIE